LLPGGGLQYGMLIEWLAELPGRGAATLSWLAAREACRVGGTLVVVDRQRTFYPPAAVAWGVDPRRLIVVRPRSLRDELWATVQALRSPAAAAVWAPIERLDDRAFRRLQLAAQRGRTLGLLLRPASARGQPSWADVRLWVGARQPDKERGRQGENDGRFVSLSPCLPVSLSGSSCRCVHVQVLRCHGDRPGKSALLEIDDVAHRVREVDANHDTHPLPLVAELADPATRSSSARA
jgi:hypothetical protein